MVEGTDRQSHQDAVHLRKPTLLAPHTDISKDPVSQSQSALGPVVPSEPVVVDTPVVCCLY